MLARLAFGQGDLWVLLAATGWAFYTVLQKRLPQPAVPASAKLAVMMAAGALALAPFAAVETLTGAAPAWSDPRLAAALLFLAIVPSLGAYYVYGRLISQAGPATAGCRCSWCQSTRRCWPGRCWAKRRSCSMPTAS